MPGTGSEVAGSPCAERAHADRAWRPTGAMRGELLRSFFGDVGSTRTRSPLDYVAMCFSPKDDAASRRWVSRSIAMRGSATSEPRQLRDPVPACRRRHPHRDGGLLVMGLGRKSSRAFGTKTFKEVLQPAVEYADQAFRSPKDRQPLGG